MARQGATRFHLVLHLHQPYGNLETVFEQAWAACYRPLIEAFHAAPRIRWNLHVTGAVWEWIERHAAGHLDRIGEMVDDGRLELIGGGFYEPILSLVPRRDARDQIERTAAYLERRFGRRPRGAWIAERVFQPDVAEILAACGVAYTFLDDLHLLRSGTASEPIGEYVVTESRGETIAIFPIDKPLRYAIPFREPDAAMARIRALAEGGLSAVTYGDDGEKFGLWPDTARVVWQDGWLERFLDALAADPEIATTLCAETLGALAPRARVYPPVASYDEMEEWALPPGRQREHRRVERAVREVVAPDVARAYVTGAPFGAFLARYPEVDRMHKRMVDLSARIARHEAAAGRGVGPDGDEAGPLARARRALHRAQVNCPYWHGLFGGCYVPFLRHVVGREIARAEAALAEAGAAPDPLRQIDLDRDGVDDLLGGAGPGRFVLSSRWAGGLVDWSRWDVPAAPVDVMARWREAYHAGRDDDAPTPAEGEGRDSGPGDDEEGRTALSIHERRDVLPDPLARRLIEDRAPRVSAVDMEIPADLDAEAFWRGAPGRTAAIDRRARFRPLGDRRVEIAPADAPDALWRRIVTFDDDGTRLAFEHRRDRLDASRRLAVEWNVALHHAGIVLIDGSPALAWPDEQALFWSHDEVRRVEVVAEGGPAVELIFDRPVRLLGAVIETILRTESGYEPVRQGLSLLASPAPGEGALVVGARLRRVGASGRAPGARAGR